MCSFALLVVVHAFVPARLRWRDELSRLSLVNRQIYLTATFAAALWSHLSQRWGELLDWLVEQ